LSKETVLVESRKTLYYKQYQYKARFLLDGVSLAARSINIPQLEKWIANQLKYYDRFSSQIALTSKRLQSNKEALGKFLLWKSKYEGSIKIRTEGASCTVFANDLKVLKKLEKIATSDVVYNRVELYGDPETIDLVDPKHKYRVYLKSKRVADYHAFGTELTEFFELHKKTLFPCPALKLWAWEASNPSRNAPATALLYSYRYNWLPAKYFIEYDNESTMTLLSFVLDGYLKKSHKVVQRES
jgi:hypothetical protein